MFCTFSCYIHKMECELNSLDGSATLYTQVL